MARRHRDRLNIVATFNLAYNAGIMVREGLGYAVVFDHLIDTCPASDLCFRPIVPAKTSGMKIIWRKYQVFTPAATRLLEVLKADLEREFEAAARDAAAEALKEDPERPGARPAR